MSNYIHLSGSEPATYPEYGLVATRPVGRTMCGMEYGPGNDSVVSHRQPDEVTCPKCLEAMENSGFAFFNPSG